MAESDLRPLMIVVAGPNGSGKTSITETLLRHKWFDGCEYINPDNIAQEKFGGWNNDKAVIEAANYAENLREQYIKERKNFVFETVLSHPSKIEFIQKAIDEGYFVRLFFVGTNNPMINAARITARVMQGGHAVPIEKIISRFAKSLTNSIDSSLMVDRAYFYDNSVDGRNPELLFKMVDGEITKYYIEHEDLQNLRWADSVVSAIGGFARASRPPAP